MNLSTRRRLLKTGLASALFAVSGAPIASSPRRGGCLRLAIDGNSAPPFGLPGSVDHEFFHLATYAGVFETLVEIAPDGMLRGELAQEWWGSPDARIWSFRLHDGVQFHDGTPLVAEQVAAALEGQLHSWALQNVSGIKVTDRLEIQATLSKPDTSFPFLLCSPEFAIHIGTTGSILQGTGPYRTTQYSPCERLDAVRIEQAHHEGAGYFDRVQILASEMQSRRVQLLNSGRVDALVETAPFHLPRQLSAPGMQAEWTRDARFLVFDMSQISSDEVRQRLKNAVNAEEMVKDVLHGRGRSVLPRDTTGTGTPRPPFEFGIANGPGFDETAARLVANLARTSASSGVSFCSGRGAHGINTVRWAGSAQATALQASGSRNEFVVLAADALGLVSNRLIGPGRRGTRFPLDDARIVRRWWLA